MIDPPNKNCEGALSGAPTQNHELTESQSYSSDAATQAVPEVIERWTSEARRHAGEFARTGNWRAFKYSLMTVVAIKLRINEGKTRKLVERVDPEEFFARLGRSKGSPAAQKQSAIASATVTIKDVEAQPKQQQQRPRRQRLNDRPALQEAPPPPHNIDAEKGVLGSILQSAREAIPKCVEKIKSNFFYDPPHRTIYQALLDMHDAGDPIDLVTFTIRLGERGLLKAVGDAPYISDLFKFVPTAAAVDYYLDIVRDNYRLRETVFAATKAIRRAQSVNSAEDGAGDALLDELESSILSIRSLGENGTDSFEDAATEIDKPIITPEDVIDGVLHRGGKASFGGASKSRKTWALLELAASVASGKPWFAGFPTRKGKVLYVNFELPKAFCWKRIRAICDERQITLEPGMLKVRNLRGRVRDWLRLQQQIRRDEFALIIVDPVYKLLLLVGENMRDENRTGGVATVLDQIDALTERTGAAVAFGAHFAKGSAATKESIDRVSGSGVWARDPDTIITLTALETEDCYAVEMDLRNHAQQKPFSVRWDYPVFIRADELDPKDLKQRKPAGAAEKKFTIEKLVKAMADSPPLLGNQFVKRAARKLDCSDRTAWRLLDEGQEVNAVLFENDKWKVNLEWEPTAE